MSTNWGSSGQAKGKGLELAVHHEAQVLLEPSGDRYMEVSTCEILGRLPSAQAEWPTWCWPLSPCGSGNRGGSNLAVGNWWQGKASHSSWAPEKHGNKTPGSLVGKPVLSPASLRGKRPPAAELPSLTDTPSLGGATLSTGVVDKRRIRKHTHSR